MPDEIEQVVETEVIVDETQTPEVAVEADPLVEKSVVEKPVVKTMEESIREKYRELNKPAKTSEEKPPAKVVEKPAVVTDEQGRVRGPDGKFVAKVEEKPVDPKAAAAKVEEKPVVVDAAVAKAPTSWKGAAQAKWDALDPEIKAEVHRRETDFHKGIQQYKTKADHFDSLDSEIRPYEAMIRAANTNPQAVIRDMFNTAYVLKTGTPDQKVETLINIGREYGVDFSLLPSVQERIESGQPIIAPEVVQLRQQLSQVTQTLAQQEQQRKVEADRIAKEEQDSATQQIQTFGKDKEHFQTVRLDMAALLDSGRANDLQDAYDKACWAIPEVREKLIAKQRETERAQAAEKAAAAKRASATNVTVRGTPPVKPAAVVGTMEDTIRNRLRELNAARA